MGRGVPKETGLLSAQDILGLLDRMGRCGWLWPPILIGCGPPHLHVLLLYRPLTTLSSVPGGGTLRTCVLRPPGIYGPEEQRHLPRVAVGPPSLPVPRGRSQVDTMGMLTGLLQLSVTASV